MKPRRKLLELPLLIVSAGSRSRKTARRMRSFNSKVGFDWVIIPSKSCLQHPLEKLDAIQELHLWRPMTINSGMVQLVYASRYTVSIPCVAFTPVPSGVTISRIPPPPNKRPDPFPHLSELALTSVQSGITTMRGTMTSRQVGRSPVSSPQAHFLDR